MTARLLVIAGGQKLVGIASDDGNTALHLATMNSHFRTIALLLQDGGANPNANNKFGQSPLAIAQAKRDKELLAFFDPEKVVLLERIATLEEEAGAMREREMVLTNEKELEIKKTMHVYKQLAALEQELVSANSRAVELSMRLKKGEQQYNEVLLRMESMQGELERQTQLSSSLQAQMQSAPPATAPSQSTESYFGNEVRVPTLLRCVFQKL